MRRPAETGAGVPGSLRHHGLIRPAVSCLLLAVFGALACYAGLLLDERTLMATAIVAASMAVLSLSVAVAQWVMAGRAGAARPSWPLRPLRPSDVAATALYERIDQYGNVVDRWTGALPRERGLYRRAGTMLRWRSPFGLFMVRRRVAAVGETPVLPEAVDADARGTETTALGRAVALRDAEDSGSVRGYEPGDPIKRIAWRHSARRGRLMTRESEGDERATLLLVANVDGSDGVDGPRLDGAVAALLPYAKARRGMDVMATDGVHTVEGEWSVLRFLAAVRPVGGRDDARGRGRLRGRLHERMCMVPARMCMVLRRMCMGRDTTCTVPQASCGISAATCTVSVGNIVRRRSGPVEVLVCDASDSNGLADALRRSSIGAAVRVLDPAPQERVEIPQERVEIPQERVEIPQERVEIPHKRPETMHKRPETMQVRHIDRHVASSGSDDARRPAGKAPWIPRIVASLALLTYFGVTLKALAGLVNPTGWWIWFAAGALAAAVFASAVQGRPLREGHPLRAALIRLLCFTFAMGVAAFTLVVLRSRDVPIATPAGDSADSAGSTGFWSRFIVVLSTGFDRLDRQLPPLRVAPASDVLLIVVIAAAVVLIRCLLFWRPAVPLLAVLPVVALAADSAMLGHIAPWWAIALLAFALPMGMWAVSRPSITIPSSAASAAFAAILVMAVTLAGTPSAEALAYRVPLSIGEGGGMFTSNTVSPLIDLKRNIDAGSDSVVLDYSADRRLYLKLTTLDAFDGDTWGYDRELAIDAGLYGSGIRLGRDKSDDLTMEQRRAGDPIGIYAWMLGYAGYDVGGGDSGGGGSGSDDGDDGTDVDEHTLERYETTANVRIDTLRSRFLPVPGIASGANGADSSWLRYRDGSMVNRTDATSSGMRYTVSGTYIDPISSASGFSELDPVREVVAALERRRDASDDRLGGWLEARRAIAASGLGEVRDGFAVIRASITPDGAVRASDGTRIGRVSTYSMSTLGEQGNGRVWRDGSAANRSGGSGSSRGSGTQVPGSGVGSSASGDRTSGVPSSGNPIRIAFDTSFGNRYGPDDAGVVYGFSASGDAATIVMPLQDVTDDAGGDDGGNGTSGASGVWAQNAITLLVQDDAVTSFFVRTGSAGDDRRMASRILAMAAASDEEAHASRYTSLPKSLPANVRVVVRRARAAGVAAKAGTYDEQVRAMRWLVGYFTDETNHFTYSMDAPDGDGRSNMQVIDDFLDPDGGHAGYCQHYAAALAVLGRAMGVPTRIVLGYNAGTAERDADGYFPVASRQLHAWVEAYLDGVGWVPFDVTPPSEENGMLTADGSPATSDASSAGASGALTGDDGSAITEFDTTGNGNASARRNDAESGADGKTDDTASRDGDTGRSSAASGPSAWLARSAAWFTALPVRWRVALAVGVAAAALVACVAAPRAARGWRRRRCVAAARRAESASGSGGGGSGGGHDDGGDASAAMRAAAWRMAWTEIRREGRAAGARWDGADTDLMIADRVAAVWPGDADGARGRRAMILRVARAAAAAAFGGGAPPVDGLADGLATLFAATRR